jgi:hypothetical protein
MRGLLTSVRPFPLFVVAGQIKGAWTAELG